MPSFSAARHMQISTAIKSLRDRCVAHVPNKITMKDVVDAYVDPEHIKILSEAQRLTGATNVTGITHKVELPSASGGVHLQLTAVNKHRIPLLPGYVSEGPRNPEGIGWQKISSYLTQIGEINRDFATMQAIVNRLNTQCTNPAGVRFYFPTVVALIAMDSDAKELVDRLRQLHVPKAPLFLEPEFRAAIKQMATRYALAELLSPDYDTPLLPVTVSFYGIVQHPTPWGQMVPGI